MARFPTVIAKVLVRPFLEGVVIQLLLLAPTFILISTAVPSMINIIHILSKPFRFTLLRVSSSMPVSFTALFFPGIGISVFFF